MRKLLILLLSCTVALFAAYSAYRGYKVWKQSHMISIARGFIAKGDNRNAFLSVEQALQANPVNLEATRLMADLMQGANSPAALFWRSRVVELAPASVEDRLALVSFALANRDLATATNALAAVNDAGKQTVGYHNVAGAVAVATGSFVEAEAQFKVASQLEPTNAAVKLNLAVARLGQTNTHTKAEGRASLKQLCPNPQVRCKALRELIGDALRNRQLNEALALSRQLLQDANSVFSDRLLRLDVLHEARAPEFNSSLAAVQKEAGDDPVKVTALASWQMRQMSPAAALADLEAAPATVQTNAIVALVAADCRVQLKDWRGLQTSLPQQNWGEVDFTRHAFLARAFRGQDMIDSAKTEWEQAFKAANAQKQNMVILLRLATGWKWQSEAEDLLSSIVNRYPEEQWAVQSLAQTLFMEGRTRSLLALFTQLAKRSPGDLAVKNNLAMTALLLDAKELKPDDLAREAYEKSPTNSSFASTYAFSLHLQSQNAEALKVMEKIPLRELEKPTIAGYYGLILKATGNKAKAKAYLAWAQRAQLLPEEKKLFDQASAGV
jgi:cytochrome c-type biogenesis protein CcmH/NrfG